MNTVQLIGRLTSDPDLRATQSGTPVCTLRLAVPRLRGRDGSDRGAVFVNVETWGKQATNAAKYLAKGRSVAVTGRVEFQEWTPEGSDTKRSRTYIVADEPLGVQFLDSPREQNGNGNGQPDQPAEHVEETVA